MALLTRPGPAGGFLFGHHLRLLFAQMPRHVLEHAVEQRVERLVQAVAENAVAFRFLLRGADALGDLAVHRGMGVFVPLADRDQMGLQARDRVT